MKKILLLLLFVSLAFNAKAQQTDEVILTIDNQPIYRSEFEQVFSKNLELVKTSSQEVENYIDLFIDYKLKLIAAHDLGLDTLKTFKNEYALYKNKLAEKYLKESEVTEKLTKEAYQHLQEEINASHILILLQKGASAKDTLEAYKKIEEARNKIINGEDFVKIAKAYSEDPSVSKNDGNVGWFSVFKMVYPFEKAAYKTKEGEISEIFKTRFGYHILKVNERRKNDGEVKVAHIMLSTKGKEAEDVKAQINKIYKKLQNGAKFSDLAKQYSQDQNTALNGGKMNAFTRGTLGSTGFEETAFSLQDSGDISQPIETKYGFHIIKLLEKNPISSYEDEKNRLQRKIKSDQRSQLINENLIKDIEKMYSVKEDKKAIDFFEKYLAKKRAIEIPEKTIISIKNEAKSYQDFADFLIEKYKVDKNKLSDLQLGKAYTEFRNEFLRNYHKKHLAAVNQEYKLVLDEYKNGLLLFDLMQKKIWNPAKEDSLALQNYYNKHQEKYKSPESYDAVIYSGDDKKVLKSVRRQVKKGVDQSAIKNNNEDILINSGKYKHSASALPKDFKGKKGVSKIYENNGLFLVVDVQEKYEERQLSFKESKGSVITDYQNKLEKEWLSKLRSQHKIELNQVVVEKSKKKFE
ncbi:peptidylprolyl isomerase [Mesonia aquimarina]|uniref:peptidylprolyl isomerase n=1 Tax=Mesonia aquimarina TaxID=1504967 RepID=UPI0013CEF408|nr:peptidylprolyl isomerase [Mesonia aquimarina]